jgi:hypothetical protein
MSTDLVEITKTLQDQYLGALTAAQDTFLETYAKVTATADKYVPAELRTPVKDLPIEPKAAIDLGFGFVSQILDAQRSFAERILATTPLVAPSAATPKAAASSK